MFFFTNFIYSPFLLVVFLVRPQKMVHLYSVFYPNSHHIKVTGKLKDIAFSSVHASLSFCLSALPGVTSGGRRMPSSVSSSGIKRKREASCFSHLSFALSSPPLPTARGAPHPVSQSEPGSTLSITSSQFPRQQGIPLSLPLAVFPLWKVPHHHHHPSHPFVPHWASLALASCVLASLFSIVCISSLSPSLSAVGLPQQHPPHSASLHHPTSRRWIRSGLKKKKEKREVVCTGEAAPCCSVFF